MVSKKNLKKIKFMFILELTNLQCMSRLIGPGHKSLSLSSFRENEK